MICGSPPQLFLFGMHHALNEIRYGRLELRQRLLMNIHHVPRLEIFHVNPLADIRNVASEMIHRVLCRKERRSQIEVSIKDQNI